MWLIGVEVEQKTSAPPPKKNPGSAPAKGLAKLNVRYNKVLLHQSSFPYILQSLR